MAKSPPCSYLDWKQKHIAPTKPESHCCYLGHNLKGSITPHDGTTIWETSVQARESVGGILDPNRNRHLPCSTSTGESHPWRGGRMLGQGMVAKGCNESLWLFPTIAIYSSFHTNRIIWWLKALGRGERFIKSMKAHSSKWVGRSTTFSPESNPSAIHMHRVRWDRQIGAWLNYT